MVSVFLVFLFPVKSARPPKAKTPAAWRPVSVHAYRLVPMHNEQAKPVNSSVIRHEEGRVSNPQQRKDAKAPNGFLLARIHPPYGLVLVRRFVATVRIFPPWPFASASLGRCIDLLQRPTIFFTRARVSDGNDYFWNIWKEVACDRPEKERICR